MCIFAYVSVKIQDWNCLLRVNLTFLPDLCPTPEFWVVKVDLLENATRVWCVLCQQTALTEKSSGKINCCTKAGYLTNPSAKWRLQHLYWQENVSCSKMCISTAQTTLATNLRSPKSENEHKASQKRKLFEIKELEEKRKRLSLEVRNNEGGDSPH